MIRPGAIRISIPEAVRLNEAVQRTLFPDGQNAAFSQGKRLGVIRMQVQVLAQLLVVKQEARLAVRRAK